MVNIFDFNSLLKSVPYESNILEYYDNVTYNIRFYMINQVYQRKLSLDRQNGIIPNNYQLDDSSKVIIAETGVVSNYDITSLTIKTIHNSIASNPSATTYQMDMRLKEINGCSLVNKITAVSKLLGYENYVLQPFHVDIWFSGYEQSTGLPIKVIGNQVLTYEVLLGEVKTNIDDITGTTYNFVMTPVPTGTFNKSVNSLFNIGNLEIKTGTLRGFKEAIEKMINDRFFENNPQLEDLFPTRDFFVIDNLVDGDINTLNKRILQVYNERPEYSIVPIQQTQTPIFGQTPMQTSFKTIKNEKVNVGMDLYNYAVDLNSMPQNTDDTNGGMIHPANDESFDSFFQNLCFSIPALRNHTARPIYRAEHIGNFNGQQIYRIHVDIVFKKNNYLDYFLKRSQDKSQNKDNEAQRIKEMQLTELQDLVANQTLVKKYEYLFNGTDTSVLEINSSVDKLWYANVPMQDIASINESSTDNVIKSNYHDYVINNLELLRNDTIYKEKLDKVVSISNRPLDGVRNLAADKRLYLDDVYNCIDDKMKADFLSGRNILEKHDEFSKTTPATDSSNANPEAIIAKVGYNNIFKAGNLCELKIKILGDPFWLGLCSDNILYAPNNTLNSSAFQHFTFKMNTAMEQNTNGTYNPESVVDFTTIYQLVESVSLFEDGKFTQQLNGVISVPFINLGRLEI